MRKKSCKENEEENVVKKMRKKTIEKTKKKTINKMKKKRKSFTIGRKVEIDVQSSAQLHLFL